MVQLNECGYSVFSTLSTEHQKLLSFPSNYCIFLEPLLRIVLPYAGDLIYWFFLFTSYCTVLATVGAIDCISASNDHVLKPLPLCDCQCLGLPGGFKGRMSLKDVTLARQRWHSCKKNDFSFQMWTMKKSWKHVGRSWLPAGQEKSFG